MRTDQEKRRETYKFETEGYVYGSEKGNFIKINRSILEWEWYQNINTKVLFLHILLKANWKDGRWQGHDIPRGSFITSIGNLSQETGLTVNQVRTAIDHLKKSGEITIKTTNKFTVINVVKYSVYQDFVTTESQAETQSNHNQITNKPQTNHKQTTTIEERKEYKEIEEGKKERISAPSSYPPSFESAWNKILGIYPKHSPKDDEAKEAFFQMSKSIDDKRQFLNDTLESINDYLEEYRDSNPDDAESLKFILGFKRFVEEELPGRVEELENNRNRFTGWNYDGNAINCSDLMDIKTNQVYDHSADPAFMEILSEIYRRYPIHEFKEEAYEKAFLFLVNQYPDSEGANRLYAACARYFEEKKENKDWNIPDLGYWLCNVAGKYMNEIKEFKKIV